MNKVSIVTTLYYSSEYIEEFYQRMRRVLQILSIDSYEFIFVNDGSPDNSLKIALDLKKREEGVTIIDLSRNFGHHKAIMTGLGQANGEYIFLVDVDLEEEPELLIDFWETFFVDGVERETVDVVYGVQEVRRGGVWERVTGGIFYTLFNFFVDEKSIQIPRNFVTARLMSCGYVNALLKMNEKEFYFAPCCSYVGFKQIPVTIKKKTTSPTTYTFLKKYHMLINAVFTFSNKPLFFSFYLGFFLTSVAGFFGAYLLIKKIVFGVSVEGWTSMMVSVWFLFGVIILVLGIISIYLAKIFTETKNRPFSIIKKIY